MLELTEAKSQRWTRFEASDDEYQTETESFVFFVRSRDDDGNAPYVLEIARKIPSHERLIKVLRYVTGGPTIVWDQFEIDETVERLYELAKASAWGLEETESELLKELGVD
ncbi:hypothetical protein [Microcella humidisoli]|jgi:hypothetical protein|uniref:Uncharacterized protein n=1 Tax=Microcella humidisoli TaxID=2963406 RepID=A0ABY5FYB1_9MICO|nr:hypothetical protein [Microcella humidisoli]UTT63315.1 hypothetical protein NNL39_04220 [Microcella humidisoli]